MKIWAISVVAALALMGCSSEEKQAGKDSNAKVAKTAGADAKTAASGEYFEVESKGRTYVVGSKATADKAAKGSHPQLAVTKIGYSPAGQTVVFESDAKDPNLEKRLMAECDRRHKK